MKSSLGALVATAAVLAAPLVVRVAEARAGDKKAELDVAHGEVPEARLVDVAIDVFAPGVSDTPPSPLLQQGIRASVRKSEARYIPFHLKDRLAATGFWGAVRVVPVGTENTVSRCRNRILSARSTSPTYSKS